MTVAEIASRFQGAKEIRPGAWMAKCASHDDRDASLSITSGTAGKVLLRCHAGCPVEKVVSAAGLTMKHLFQNATGSRSGASPRLVATYDYTDGDGKLLFQVCRYSPKTFKQRRPDGAGGWTWNLHGITRRVLYRLPEVLKAKAEGRTIHITEGEKDADALVGLGLVATCNSGGATDQRKDGTLTKWADQYTDTLVSADVVLLPDRDDPGRRHADLVARALYGKVKSLRVVELPDRDGKPVKDAADWIGAGGTAADLQALVERTPTWSPESQPELKPADPLDAVRQLQAGATTEQIEHALRGAAAGLLGLDALKVALARDEVAALLKKIGCTSPARLVDAAFGELGEQEPAENGLALVDPTPWPDPVDGDELLHAIVGALVRFVSMHDSAATAAGLWVLHAHAHDAAFVSPLLGVCSPEKRCGKTTLLSVLGTMLPRPLHASNVTPSVLFRVVEKHTPSVLVDEADTFLKDNDELRGILNCGHTRTSAFVIRNVGDNHEPTLFKTWAPKAIALIGTLPATLEDRSIVIELRRKQPGEQVERLRADRLAELEPLRRQAWTWARTNMDALSVADPSVPEVLHDRAADNWRALLAIADLIGGEWPARARDAALVLSGARDDEAGSTGEKLLHDIRQVLHEDQVDRIFSEALVERLVAMEDRPWAEYAHGRPLSKNRLAKKLHPFGVMPRTVRIGDERAKGYMLDDFQDAFARYLPPETVTPCQPLQTEGETDFSNRDTKEPCHVSKTTKTLANKGPSRCHGSKEGIPAAGIPAELVELTI